MLLDVLFDVNAMKEKKQEKNTNFIRYQTVNYNIEMLQLKRKKMQGQWIFPLMHGLYFGDFQVIIKFH